MNVLTSGEHMIACPICHTLYKVCITQRTGIHRFIGAQGGDYLGIHLPCHSSTYQYDDDYYRVLSLSVTTEKQKEGVTSVS
jgi:hypothetical protein